MLEFLVILSILAVVAFVVIAPLRRARRGPAPSLPDAGAEAPSNGSEVASLEAARQAEIAGLEAARSEIAELEAAREAKYREIRDAELDHGTGKLSDLDYETTDRTLRAEAIAILRELDRRRGPGVEEGAAGGEEPPGD